MKQLAEYGAMIAITDRLLKRELITDEEHQKLTAALTQKYRPTVGSAQITPQNYAGETGKGGKI